MIESQELPNKKFYNLSDLSEYYGVTQKTIREFLIGQTFKTTRSGSQYLMVPKEVFLPVTKSQLDQKVADYRKKIRLDLERRAIILSRLKYLGIMLLILFMIIIGLLGSPATEETDQPRCYGGNICD